MDSPGRNLQDGPALAPDPSDLDSSFSMRDPVTDSQHELIIEPHAGMSPIDLHELWRFRELFYMLAWREIKVRYKQTVLGTAWAVFQPVITMIVFTLFFGVLIRVPSDNVPYPIFVYAGLLPWTFFSNGISRASNSLLGDANMISKVYFPRLIMPTATVITSFIDFLISLVILVGLMIYYRFAPGWNTLFLPLFILLALLASLGPGLWITALNVKYRDFRYVIPFIVQFGLYVSPVGFSSNVIPAKWRLFYSLNPLVGIIDGFRWCILGGETGIYRPGFALSLIIIIFFLWLGISRFRKMEKTFADLI